MAKGNDYNAEYFENGIASGKSGYQDYRWMPERTIRFAHKISNELKLKDGDQVLDYGCAKGFMVKAFRILDIDAYGCDISEYAINEADKETAPYLKLIENGKIPFNEKFDHIISKDVFEHLDQGQLEKTLSECTRISNNLFVVVPFGDGKKYDIPQYENDVTHKLREPREWWEKKFEDGGWNVDRFSYLIKGMKENWARYPKGNGFFFLSKK